MKYVAPLAAVIGSALVAFAEPIQGLIVAHPALASVFGILSTLVAYFAQSPVKK